MSDPPPTRKALHHHVPHWVEDGSLFFITLNCADRGRPHLTNPSTTARALLEAAAHYHEQHQWHLSLMLVMPDHLHAIIGFARTASMADLLQNWKRYTHRQFNIVWQKDFFDHRLRNDHEVQAKHHYILQNPVRQQLCERPEHWPHQLRATPTGLIYGCQ